MLNSTDFKPVALPESKPQDPRFSSGPCRKYPGWNASQLDTSHLGCSHRAPAAKASLTDAIKRSATLLGLPADWQLGIMPGSDTGAFEAAMWSLLGSRGVDVLVWESFSADWANDLKALNLKEVNEHTADYGTLPDLKNVNIKNDLVFVYNGTTSGVRLPNLDWIPTDREGLVLCDATSAAFAMPLDFSRLDAVTWSWQKTLGGEAAHGMLALSPRAVSRLETTTPAWPIPKVFRLTKNGKLIDGIFKGATINTPSMLAVADLHCALDWAESIGGLSGLEQRTKANFSIVDQWVQNSAWVDWLADDPSTRSPTSMCLKISEPQFNALDPALQRTLVDQMTKLLREHDVAWDIGAYRTAPLGFRLWGGPTINHTDFEKLVSWLDWSFAESLNIHNVTLS